MKFLRLQPRTHPRDSPIKVKEEKQHFWTTKGFSFMWALIFIQDLCRCTFTSPLTSISSSRVNACLYSPSKCVNVRSSPTRSCKLSVISLQVHGSDMVHGNHDRASIDKFEFFVDFKNANLFLLNSKVHGRLTVWIHMCPSYRT